MLPYALGCLVRRIPQFYPAPELARLYDTRVKCRHPVTAMADVWSLGVMLAMCCNSFWDTLPILPHRAECTYLHVKARPCCSVSISMHLHRYAERTNASMCTVMPCCGTSQPELDSLLYLAASSSSVAPCSVLCQCNGILLVTPASTTQLTRLQGYMVFQIAGPGAPEALVVLIKHCMAANPSKRPRMFAIQAALSRWLADGSLLTMTTCEAEASLRSFMGAPPEQRPLWRRALAAVKPKSSYERLRG